uniref:AN1-type domain-containing protein n=1 Tax=Ascaris lumbricoides TaxID=6252 RepID=A0A0M3HQS4_ASCLU
MRKSKFADSRKAQPQFTPGRSLMIEITVKSMMQNGESVVVMVRCVRKDATVRELKRACRGKIDLKLDQQSLMYSGQELRDDEAHLQDYGITHDSTVYLHPKMLSGIRDRNPGNNIILVLPSFFVNPDTLASLTPMIAKRPQTSTDKQPKMSAEKQIEHQLTRNRALMRRRKLLKRSQSSPPCLNSESGSACGSICGSAARLVSPMDSEPSTPPPGLANTESKNDSLATTNVEMKDPLAATPITEKELKGFFDPPETMQEMEFVRRDMYDPPQNREELEKVRSWIRNIGTLRCKVCRKRLRLAQRTIRCACDGVFCDRHRSPEAHQCSVDYKQQGRMRLLKENPKVDEGGAHKAKQDA